MTSTGVSRRSVVVGTAATVAGATALRAGTAVAAGSQSAEADSAAPVTVVLVHGAFIDASAWYPVIGRLQAKRHRVISAATPLRGLPVDAAHLKSVLDRVDGPVVVVGHSYGGAVVTEAAAHAANVKALVYVAALVPDVGETAGELAFRYPGSELQPVLEQVSATAPDGTPRTDLYIKQESFGYVYAGDVPAALTRVSAAAQRPVSASALTDVTTSAAWRTLPSWNLVTTQDRILPPELQNFQAQRANSKVLSIAASHLPMLSRPDAVANLITDAVRATI
ncbi:alpha/beta fold hydrolase [Yinghuangia sp. YIM S09857]|uniref:alpha/beta fold hydrolase n=1 Tax=Yinghuangia sp. YIM S09857 TaxID=3436929 RepID=UPI003F53C5C7